MHKIAIIGNGLAGTAACWYLLHSIQSASITVFDKGGGASLVAPGLLHPFIGRRCIATNQAKAGMTESLKLLDIASHIQESPVYIKKPLLRIPRDEQQKQWFKDALKEDTSLQWWEGNFLGLVPQKGLLIPHALQVDIKAYLKGLQTACEIKGAQFIHREISSLKSLRKLYDIVILANGWGVTHFTPCPIEPVKGQVLHLKWPKGTPIPPMNLMRQKYLVTDKTMVQAGATFEHHFDNERPDLDLAKQTILPDIVQMVPCLEKASIVQVQAGIRAMPLQRAPPIVKEVSTGLFVLTGLGSKGLLYHAPMAKKLALLVADRSTLAGQ